MDLFRQVLFRRSFTLAAGFLGICKWTLTLLAVESSSAVFAIYFMRSAGLFALIKDGGKTIKSLVAN